MRPLPPTGAVARHETLPILLGLAPRHPRLARPALCRHSWAGGGYHGLPEPGEHRATPRGNVVEPEEPTIGDLLARADELAGHHERPHRVQHARPHPGPLGLDQEAGDVRPPERAASADTAPGSAGSVFGPLLGTAGSLLFVLV